MGFAFDKDHILTSLSTFLRPWTLVLFNLLVLKDSMLNDVYCPVMQFQNKSQNWLDADSPRARTILSFSRLFFRFDLVLLNLTVPKVIMWNDVE